MNSRNSGRRLESFFAGRGFYIVLFLCAAVIGVSAWMTANGNKAMSSSEKQSVGIDNKRIETVVLQPVENDTAPVISELPSLEEAGNDTVLSEVWHQGDMIVPDAPEYVWPVSGETERPYSSEELHYDVTLQDWRTHEALDISAPMGEQVLAAHSGIVDSIYEDGLYGTVMVISHGDGIDSIYANLDSTPAVNVGDTVSSGDVIGAVGNTALCEIGQGAHLHFAMRLDGEYIDPAEYLPA